MSDVLREQSAMRRAIELAAFGPLVGGNPQVGCVLMNADGQTVAEGWHRGAGTPHAEIDALTNAVNAGRAAEVRTAVVTLEPCNHVGRTGPCAEALIDAGVQRVVYAVDDPGRVSGGGAERLRDAGVEVVGGVMADEVEAFIRPWLATRRRHRPWVTVKWASTLDGRAAAADGSSQWITGPEARADGHRLRAESDAILTGTGTVIAADPSLTARDPAGALLPHQPLPVVVGGRPVPAAARLRAHPAGFVEAGEAPLSEILDDLYRRDVVRVLVEAGPTLTSAIVSAGLADEFAVYLAPKLLGGPGTAIGDLGIAGIDAALDLVMLDVRRIGPDLAITARPRDPGGLDAGESRAPRTADGEAVRAAKEGD